MKKILLISVCAVSVMGCANKPVEVKSVEGPIPNEKYVVAKNLDEALKRSETKINNNWLLLKDIESKRALSPQVLEHNNNLDARSVNDKRKIVGPQLGQGQSVTNVAATNINKENVSSIRMQEDNANKLKGTDNTKVMKFNNVIGRLKWQNSGLNELLRSISTQVGYEFMVVPSKIDNIMFNMEIQNPTSTLKVLELAAKINEQNAEITVSHVRQTITVKYK